MSNILIFDSGIGGVSIYRQIKKNLPDFDYVYLADNAFFPYGNKTQSQLKQRAQEILSQAFVKYDCPLVVIACNTMTSVAIEQLRATYPNVTFVGTEPAIKQALEYTAGNVLVVGTSATVNSLRLRTRFPSSNIIWRALPDLAQMIEDNTATDSQIKEYIASNCSDTCDVDCVVLGCTHYSLVRELFAGVFVGKKIFDGSVGVAQRVKTVVKQLRLRSIPNPCVSVELTDNAEQEYLKYVALLKSI